MQSIVSGSVVPDEIIICLDDHNISENLKERILDYSSQTEVKVIQNATRKGVSYSYNMALKACNGDYIAIASDDDIWFPKKLEKQLMSVDQKTIVFTSAEFFNGKESWRRPDKPLKLSEDVLSYLYSSRCLRLRNPRYLPFSSLLVPRSASTQLFREDLSSFEDVVWVSSLLAKGYRAVQLSEKGLRMDWNRSRSASRPTENAMKLSSFIASVHSQKLAARFLRYHAIRVYVLTGKTKLVSKLWNEAAFYEKHKFMDKLLFPVLLLISEVFRIQDMLFQLKREIR